MNLLLSLTEQCNLRCSYCYYKESHEDRSLVMTDEIMEKSIELALERSIRLNQSFFNITFFGGEPLMRMDAIRRGVKFTKKLVKVRKAELPKGFECHFAVNTNGTLLTPEIVAYLKKEKFRVYVSLDGPERHHNISRVQVNGKGSFRLIKPHIQELVDLNATVLSVVTRAHVKTLSKSVKWIAAQGFKNMTTALDFDGKWTGEDLDNLAREYVAMAKFWLNDYVNGGDLYIGSINDKIALRLNNWRERTTTCEIFKGGMGVAANGNAFPCSRFISSKPDAKYMLGNVLTDGEKIFGRNATTKCITKFLNHDKAECKDCGIKYRCAAHECACTAFYTTGTIEGVSPEVCTHERILTAICDDLCDAILEN